MNIDFSWNFSSSHPLLNHLHLRLLKGIGKTTTDLIADLASPDVREYAIQILVSFGDEVVPHLVQSLANDNPDVRQAVAQILEQIGPAAQVAIPDLVQRLVDTDCRMRDTAAQALDKIDTQWHKTSQVQTAIPYLVQRLTDGINVRRAAVQALDKINKQWHKIAIPYLVQQLKDSKANTRMAAINALKEIGPTAQAAIPNLLQRLADDIRYVREAATESLDKIDPQWRKIPQAQTAILAQQQANNIQNARETEAKIAAAIQQLKHSDPDERKAAARKLVEIGPTAKTAIPDLIEAMTNVRLVVSHSEDTGSQVVSIGDDDAAMVLEKINPKWREEKSTVPALIKILQNYSKDGYKRGKAAEILGLIGPAAEAAIPALLKSLNVTYSFTGDFFIEGVGWREKTITFDTCDEVFKALNAINPKWNETSAATDAISTLITYLDISCDTFCAFSALKRIGPEATKAAIPALMSLLSKEDNTLKNANRICDAASALGQIGPAAQAAIPALIQLLSKPHRMFETNKMEFTGISISDYAETALNKIDPQWRNTSAAATYIPIFIAALADKSSDVRKGAAGALRQIGPTAQTAIPALMQFLVKYKNLEAARSLDTIDPQWHKTATARVAIPALIQLLRKVGGNSDRTCESDYIVNTLDKIDPQWRMD